MSWGDLAWIFLSGFAGSFLGAYFGSKAFRSDQNDDRSRPNP